MAAVYPENCGSNESMYVDGTDDSYFENCNVGIGCTNPSESLHVYNNLSAGIKLESNTGNAVFMADYSGDAGDSAGVVIQQAGTTKWRI